MQKTMTAETKQTTRPQLITPDWARAKLATNTRNRTPSDAVVKAYALDMKNGNWLLNHQGIAFNDKGELIDGQHRLMAVIQAGVPVMMNVTTGCRDEEKNGIVVNVMDTVDRGRLRSVGQQLAMGHGITNGNRVAAVCKGIVTFLIAYDRRLSTAQTLHILKIYRDSIDSVFSVHDSPKRLPAYIAAPIVLFHDSDPDTAIKFAEAFCTRENLSPKSPVLALMRWLDNHPHAGRLKNQSMKVAASCLYHFKQGGTLLKVYASEDAATWLTGLQKNNERKIRELLQLGD